MENVSSESLYGRIAFIRREEEWTHVTYHSELDLLEIIKRGEVEKISNRNRIRDMFPAHNGHLSDNPHRQAIYEFVACITLVTRFAVEGGLTTEQAYTLSDAYIKYADKTRNVGGVHTLYVKMLRDFAARVKRARNMKKPLSMPVIRAMEYIDSHLHNKISLQDIGKAVNRNPAYLCVQFKEEAGISISSFINHEKIEEAKHLLRNTDMAISEISMTLAYGSQSYFAKLFHERTGETPKNYRRKQVIHHR
jgi:YesN/AraC family two-component response regulator